MDKAIERERMEDKNVDPSSYTEFPDEDHSVECEWWFKDRKYKGWFNPEDLENVNEPDPPMS